MTVRARSEGGLVHDPSFTLYRGSDRVDIRNELKSNFIDVRYWAFSLAPDQPALRTEQVAVTTLDKLKSAGGDYSDTHARYDHLTVNHFADLTDGSGKKGLTISNPDLAFSKLGQSTTAYRDTTTPQLNVLAGRTSGRALPGHSGSKRRDYFSPTLCPPCAWRPAIRSAR